MRKLGTFRFLSAPVANPAIQSMNLFQHSTSNLRPQVLFLFFLMFLGGASSLRATHVMGADLTYVCIGGNEYEFTLTLYRDCDGVLPLTAFNININSASCGISAVAVVSQVSMLEISPVCAALVTNSSCSGGPFPGVQQYIYKGTYTFPAQCTDWVIGWADCCRNNAITNATIISIANGTETYIEATLDNLTTSCNSSPSFTNLPTAYVCEGQDFQYNHGASDPDGDSLAFELITPLELTLGFPTPINYIAPFSATYPVSTTPANSFGFDPATGQLNFTPDVSQIGVTAILVKEYRGGKLIGTTMRDIQIVVTNCTNTLPIWGDPTAVNGGTLNGNVFTVCAGNTLSFAIAATDADLANTLAVSTNLMTSIPGANLTTAGLNPSNNTFSWATTLADVGIHSFTLTVVDDACPIFGRQTVGFQVYVQGPVEVTASDQTVCPGTPKSIQLGARTPGSPGNGTYAWTPTTGLNDPTIAAPMATVSQASSYTVTFTEGVCTTTATVDIESVGDLTVGPDLSLCAPGPVNLQSNFILNFPPPPSICGVSTNTCGGPANTATVGSGALTSGTLATAGGAGSPFLGAWQNGRTQLLFRANDLNAAGVIPGIISEISLQVSSLFSAGGYSGFTIRMGCTGVSELTAFEPGLTQVFNGLVTPVAGANTFLLATPYEWDGASNLIVEFCFTNAVATGYDHVQYSNTSYNSVFFGFSNTNPGCTLANGFATTQRPNVSFTSCPLAVTPVYAWTPGAGLSSTTDPNPTATVNGTQDYVLTITTPGCIFTDTASIELAAPPVLNPFTPVALCLGDSVDLVPTGTDLTGTFLWTPAQGLSDPTVLSPRASPAATTLYTLTVTNACGSSTQSINVTLSPSPAVTLAATNVSCAGANDGSITATATGGSPGYTYAWTPAVGITPTVANLAPGTYALTVTDASGCTATASATITQPAPLALNLIGSTNPLCAGGLDGSIQVNATGGTVPYTFSADGINFQPGGLLAGLGAGNYNVQVRDANLCVSTVPVTLTNPAAVSAVVSALNPSDCVIANGSFTATGNGGSGGYQYSLNGGPFQLNGTFTGLAPGIYPLTVQDNNGCQGTITVSVSALNSPTGTLTGQTNVTCAGGSNGSAFVSATGGLAPYQFSIDGINFQPTGNFPNLAAGIYTVEINDVNGCPGFLTITISEPAPIVGLINAQVDITCPGGNDGSLIILGNGGTPGYTYSINGVIFSTVNQFNNLAAGTYNVTIRDAALCEVVVPVALAEPTPLTGTVVAQTNVDCPGASTGSFTVQGIGANGTYTYSLDNITFQASGTFANLPAGNYTVFIRDVLNCQGSLPVTVTQPAPLVGSIQTQVNVSCAGDANGSLTLSASGGTPGYTFSLDGVVFSANPLLTGLLPGSYALQVRDANGCLSTVAATITSPSVLNALVAASSNVSCEGLTDGSMTLAGSGGTPPYAFSIDGGVTFQPAGTFTGLSAGTYAGVVRDANNCETPVSVTLTEPAVLLVTLVGVTDLSCFGANDGSITVLASAGNGAPYTYSTDGINFQAAATLSGLSAGNFVVTVQDQNGCEATLAATVAEPPQLGMTVNALSPVTCPGGSDGAITLSGTGGTVVLPGDYEFSINGGPFQVGGSFLNLPAGSYLVTVRDNNGCTFSQTETITEPPVLGITVLTQVDVSCFGGNNGSLALDGVGGTPGYQFSLDGVNFQANGTFPGLNAGPLTISIQDLNGCVVTQALTINEPTEVVLQIINQVNVACFGDSTGALTVQGSGGTPGYVYGVAGFPLVPINTYAGIPAGIYPIVVSDAIGCTDTLPVTITQPAPIGLAIDSTQNVLCNAGNSGILYLSLSGGIGPYAYATNNGPAQGSPTITGLVAGTYQVVVTDAGGCQDSVSATITEPTPLVVTPGPVQNVTCPGGNDGSAAVTAAGGTPGYTYNWIPVGGNTPAVANLAAGSYLVDVSDGNGCVTSTVISIVQPDPIEGNITLVQGISCFGLSDAIAQSNATGGAGGYTYIWSAGIANGNISSDLPAGTHFLTITDAIGCVGQDSVTVIAPDSISTLLTADNVSCFGLSDGVATATANGGVGGYTFEWNNLPTQTSSSYANVPAGIYTVIVTDANGCEAFDTVEVTEPPLIDLVASGINETCTDANGELYALATGGAGGFSYVWNTPIPQIGDTIVGVAAGTYLVVAVDINNCTDTATVTILDEAAPTLQTANIEMVSCFGGADGSALVSALGGTGTYDFTWNSIPAQVGPALSNVAAGSYDVTVDDGQCQTTLTVVVPEPNALSVSILQTINPSCEALSDGEVIPIVSGGTPGYTFSWNTLPLQVDSIATDLPEGTFVVIVTDLNGCTDSTTAILVAPEALSLILQGDSVNCFGETTGEAIATVSGGTQPYTYLWSGTTATGDTARNLGIGVYGLQVTDENGCTTASEVIIAGPEELMVEVTGSDLTCFEQGDGTGLAVPSGGTAPYRFQWSSGSTSDNPLDLAAGTWQVTVTDARGCFVSGNVSIDQPAPLEIALEDFEGAFCDLPNGSATVSGSGGTGGYAFIWNTDPPQIGPSATGIYGGTAGMTPVVTIIDANGCLLADTVRIPNAAPAVAAFTTANLDPTQEILGSQADIRFLNESQFALSYEWDFGDGRFSIEENPIHLFGEGTFRVILTAWDENFACPDTASLLLTIVPDGVLFVPNAFTPNGDGQNDVFYFYGEGIQEFEVNIYDRWGRLIALLNGVAEGWDGRLLGGGVAPEGVYVYRLEGRLNNGANLSRSGTITLLR